MTGQRPAYPPDAVHRAGEVLAAEAARFASFGWMRGTSGNLSVVLSRDPLQLAVTGSGLDKGTLTAADVVVVDAAGEPVDLAALPSAGAAPPSALAALPSAGAAPPSALAALPSAEAALHARVARLTSAGAVVHVHTVAAVVAGRRWPTGIELSGLEMLKGIGVAAAGAHVRLPVIGNSQEMPELGDRLERAWNPRVPAVVVADHGLYAWGSNPLEARHHTEIVEWLLECAIALAR